MNTHDIKSALQKSLATPMGVAVFLIASFAVFALFVLVPVWTTPGNDIAFQLSLFTPGVYVLMAALALLNGLVIVMQFYIRREHKKMHSADAKHVAGGLGALGASLIATMGCVACYSSILALFGIAGTAFIVEHRWLFATIAIFLALFAIFHSSKKIAGGCKTCKISPKG